MLRIAVQGDREVGQQVRITPFFRWYDLWVGAYVDVRNHVIYICPMPMLGIMIEWKGGS